MAFLRMISIFLVVVSSFPTSLACTDDTPTDNAKSPNIAAFNIQVLGDSKMGKADVVNYLRKIINRYELVLIQEIRNKAGTAIEKLLAAVNANRSSDDCDFLMTVGPRVGRSTSKEQYAYFYRECKFTLMESFTYNDTDDLFEREPLIALFKSLDPNAAVSKFFIIGLHSKPTDATSEVDGLVRVYDTAKSNWTDGNVTDAILMGDFNADCSYISKTKFEGLDLVTQPRFKWLIDSTLDTTVKASDCAYDRIVLVGEKTIANGNNAEVFNFEEAYNITNALATEISDHYPVAFALN